MRRSAVRRSALAGPVAAGVVGVSVVCLGAPFADSLTSAWLYTFTLIWIWAGAAASLNFSLGYAGQLNMSGAAFIGLGAYLGVLGTGYWHWPGLSSLALAIAIAVVLSGIIGMVVFRARGLYFALLTTGISLIAAAAFENWTGFTHGSLGASTAGPSEEGSLPRPLTLAGMTIGTPKAYFIAALALLVILLWVSFVISRRRLGESWKAIREDEILAAAVGVRVVRDKRIAFIASSVASTAVGFLYGHVVGFVNPENFNFSVATVLPLAMLLIGGQGSILGPAIGALIVVGMPEVLRSAEQYSVLIFGSILLVVVLLAPRGLVGLGADGLRASRRLATRRSGR